MSTLLFEHPPSVELLQWLARGSLRQPDILSMAIRLWVILRSLYGSNSDPLYLQNLNKSFTYPDWRNTFFQDIDTHHKGDNIAQIHHPDCPCHKTITEWLFDPEMGVPQPQWLERLNQHYSLSHAEIDKLLHPVNWVYNPAEGISKEEWRNTLQQRYSLSESEINTLARIIQHPEREQHKNRPFACSRKSLKKDFKTLVELGWLEAVGTSTYKKVETFPSLAISSQNPLLTLPEISSVGRFVQSDLASIAEKFASPIHGTQRFFLHVEYIISSKLYGQVELLQEQLKKIWSQTPVPPILLTYCSAKLHQDEVERIVYPVCICYHQRAPYLFAFGQIPKNPETLNWYDYRLDRIQNVQELTWEDSQIPPQLREQCLEQTPPTPQQVSELINEALGFDFYKPQAKMILRFNGYFDYNYIEGTERDTIFKKISRKQVEKVIQNAALSTPQKQTLFSILDSGSSQDVYRQVNYHIDDNNVVMRLRAWGPNVEVIFPCDLRERMRSDLEKTWKFYK